MKVLISADMEGTCGIVSWVQVMPPEVRRLPNIHHHWMNTPAAGSE